MKGYKTVAFNVLAAVIPVLEVSGQDLGLDGNGLALYALAVSVANLVLRSLTTSPMFKK